MAKEEINPLDAILSQYEKNSERGGSSKPKVSNEERLKKYFTEKLRQGQKTAEKTFRILPSTDPTKSPFVETYYHEMNVNGKYEKIHCINNCNNPKRSRFIIKRAGRETKSLHW